MRRPTPEEDLYAWHRAALAGLNPVIDATPQCGWYKRKLVKGGVFVPARIWMFQEVDSATGELMTDEALQCEVNGRWADPDDAWPWLCGNPISEAEFRYLTARLDHAAIHEPEDAFSNPLAKVDFLTIPPLF